MNDPYFRENNNITKRTRDTIIILPMISKDGQWVTTKGSTIMNSTTIKLY